MAEVNFKKSFLSKILEHISGIFMIEPVSFSTKRRVNLKGIGWFTCLFLSIFCLVILFVPETLPATKVFSGRATSGTQPQPQGAADMPGSANVQSQSSNRQGVNSGYTLSGPYGGGGSAKSNRNTSMIIGRENDLSTTLPPGTKFWVKLSQNITVSNRTLPIIGTVVSAVTGGNNIAIPENTEVFGEAILDSDSERASISLKSVMFPDGRSKNLSALALGNDNQAGVDGNYHSDALKNTAGELISRFVGGVAEGAITRTPFGAGQGGIQNGLFQGVADTAKDGTDSWSADLKKTRAWIELTSGQQFQVILSQPFIYRDPGGAN